MKYILGIIIIVIIGGFFLLRDGTEETPDTTKDDMNGEITAKVPAPGNEGDVDEMIVLDEETEDGSVDVTTEVGDEMPENFVAVTYTDAGFRPDTITVESGQTVQFINESSGNMWVASNNHPTHTILPEFDNRSSVGEEETYQFTFTKTGSWKYHNHVNPSKGGTVVVE